MSNSDKGRGTGPKPDVGHFASVEQRDLKQRITEFQAHFRSLIEKVKSGEFADKPILDLENMIDNLGEKELKVWEQYESMLVGIVGRFEGVEQSEEERSRGHKVVNPDTNPLYEHIQNGTTGNFKEWARNRWGTTKTLLSGYRESDDQQEKEEIAQDLLTEARRYLDEDLYKSLTEVEEVGVEEISGDSEE